MIFKIFQSDRSDRLQPASSSKSHVTGAGQTPSSSVAPSVVRPVVQDDRDGHLIYQDGDVIQGRCMLLMVITTSFLNFIKFINQWKNG